MTEPTAREQYALELVNRFRIDPHGFFDRHIANAATGEAYDPGVTAALAWFFVDLDALRAQLDALTAVAPLSWNGELHGAAAAHNAAMQEADLQSHQVPGEDGLGARADAAGYDWLGLAENVYAYAENPDHAHAGFVIDWGYDTGESASDRAGGDGIQDPAGHRIALMSDQYSEVGIDWLADSSDQTSVGPWLTTQVLGRPVSDPPRIIGVVYGDENADGLFSMGEGLGAVALGLDGADAGANMGAGGYALAASAGTREVSFAAEALSRTVTVSVELGEENVKLDVAADGMVSTSADAAVTGWAAGLKALSQEGLTLRGGWAAELIEGADGDDSLFGGRGADRVRGGAGHDVIYGGGFSDALGGGSEGDRLYGGRGWDRIFGGQGDDRLFGEAGNDRLVGGLGRDRLVGGDGDDVLLGGRGRDVFVFDESDGTDRIEDWDERDVVDLRGADVTPDQVEIGSSGPNAVLNVGATTVIIVGAAGSFDESDLLLA